MIAQTVIGSTISLVLMAGFRAVVVLGRQFGTARWLTPGHRARAGDYIEWIFLGTWLRYNTEPLIPERKEGNGMPLLVSEGIPDECDKHEGPL